MLTKAWVGVVTFGIMKEYGRFTDVLFVCFFNAMHAKMTTIASGADT